MARTNDLTKAAVWQQRMSNFQSGSLTVAQFCKSVSCSVASFYQWRRKLCPTQQPPFRARQQPRPRTSAIGSPRKSAKGSPRKSAQSTSAFLPVMLQSSSGVLPSSAGLALRPSPVVVTLANGTKFELACDAENALRSILQLQGSDDHA